MMSNISSFQFLARVAQFAAALNLLSPLVQAVKITDIFTVKTSAGGGSCNDYMPQVEAWFKDSLAIASVPIAVASNAVKDGFDNSIQVDMEYLATYFRIPPPDDEPANLKRAKAFMQGEMTLDKGKPWLYCGGGWAEEVEWTAEVRADREIQENSQENYNHGTKLWEIFLGYYTVYYWTRLHGQAINLEERPPFFPWWVEDMKQYIFLPADTDGNPCESGANLASTMFQTAPWSVTLCFGNDGLGRPQLLSDPKIDPITEENQLVSVRRSVSITLYHEIIHLITGSSVDFAYDFAQIVGQEPSFTTGEEITWDQNILNPESYTLFALATYLGEQHADYVFWSGQSKSKSA
ncbi:hypothetical protein G7Z17_g1840 [Cylindrodendrum hubeiense]|uniref:Uncharacterized protein n=1 Tax=Cylindrodendrum hubeiense TaxID=595255 RepID=A0A9P5LJQ7_9HYPO|nr:hypothetical protein G7Z17_g1840 [Cylindrodendrum hubeiense]